ncbi:MAG: FRG domain-containing protein [Anaerolineae bacterium]|nr:FRG domain-containing protein [Anaerolineae bacterium]
MKSYKVNNVAEAVELAKKLKQEGLYDWFRGQKQNWRVKSSFARLDDKKRELATHKRRRFVQWIKMTPGLEHLTDTNDPIVVDSIIAIAQHYGIETNFVDFTSNPEIAGFFASHGELPKNEGTSCIICLNTKEFSDFWREPIEFYQKVGLENYLDC